MSQQQEKVFADGFSFKRKDKAPDFVVGRLSLKVDDAVVFLKNNIKNGWCNLDIKQAMSGSYYVELDTWVNPNEGSQSSVNEQELAAVNEDEDLGF